MIVDDATLSFVPDSGTAVVVKPNDSFRFAGPPAVVLGGKAYVIGAVALGLLLKSAVKAVLRFRLIDRDEAADRLGRAIVDDRLVAGIGGTRRQRGGKE